MTGKGPHEGSDTTRSMATIDGRLRATPLEGQKKEKREDLKKALRPAQKHATPTDEELKTMSGIDRKALNKYGGAYVSRAWLETLGFRDGAMDDIAECSPERIYTSIDFVGSSIAQKAVFDDRCPADLRARFIHLLQEGISTITTIGEAFNGSVDGFQGDEVTANFPSMYLACMASLAIKNVMEPILESLRKLTKEFNENHAGKGEKYEVVSGLRVAHVSAQGLNLRTHRRVSGMITRGHALKHSKKFEGEIKSREVDLDLNTTNIHVEDSQIEHLARAKADFESIAANYKEANLRMSQDKVSTIGEEIPNITQLPKNAEASSHPSTTLGVPFCIYFPTLNDETDDAEYDKLVDKVLSVMEEYQCGDIKAVMGGNGFFTTFENGDTELLAARALQATRAAIQEFNNLTGTAHKAVCGIGKKGRMIRFRAGNDDRHELTRVGLVVHELFRAMGVGIDMCNDRSGESSLAVGVATRDKLDEYCLLGETKDHATRNMDITVTELKEVKAKKRVHIFESAGDVRLIGASPTAALEKLNQLLDKKRVIKIGGSSPVNELILRKTLERKDTSSMCVVTPEGQDAFDPYQTLYQIIEQYSEIIEEEKTELYKSIGGGNDLEIEAKLKTCLEKIGESLKGGLNLCVLGAESMDEGSRSALEGAVSKMEGRKIRLIIVGGNVENPDISEKETSMISEEEAMELIEFILETKVGKTDTEIISKKDLSMIAAKLPKIGDSENIHGAYVYPWIGELINQGHLYQPDNTDGTVKTAWVVADSLEGAQVSGQGILMEKLSRLMTEFKGIDDVAYAVAAANRPVEAKELKFENGVEGNKELFLAKLAAQGILTKIDAVEGDDGAIGRVGYIVTPLYKNAIEECLVTWEAGRVEVHGKILKDMNYDSDRLFTENEDPKAQREIKEARDIWLMHNSEYFKYMIIANTSEDIIMDESELKGLHEYLKTIRIDVQKDLDLNNRTKVARRLKHIVELEKLIKRIKTNGANESLLLTEIRKSYLNLISIFSSAAQRSREGKPTLIKFLEGDCLQKIGKLIIQNAKWEEAPTDITIGLIGIRSCQCEIDKINRGIICLDLCDVQAVIKERNSIEGLNEILLRAKKYLKENLNPHLEDVSGLDESTTLRLADALQIFALIAYNVGETLLHIEQATKSENQEYIKYLDMASKYAKMAIDLTTMLREKGLPISRAEGAVTSQASLVLNEYVPQKNAEAKGLTVLGMLKRLSPEHSQERIDASIEKGLEKSIEAIFKRMFQLDEVYITQFTLPFEEDNYLQEAKKEVEKELKLKAKGGKWAKPKGLLGTLTSYSENARTLGRAYYTHEGNDINGISRKKAYEMLLRKAIKAAELARRINDYPNEQGEFIYDFIAVYNTIETYIELAMINDDPLSLQTDFDIAMEELLKIRREVGEVHAAAGVPLQSEVKKLYSWAYQAGLTAIPSEYIPSAERTVMGSTTGVEVLTMEIPSIAELAKGNDSGPFQTIGPEDEE